MSKILIVFLIFLQVFNAYAQEGVKDDSGPRQFDHNFRDDFMQSLGYLKDGSYEQFTITHNLILAGGMALLLLFGDHEDRELSAKRARHHAPRYEKIISNLSIFFNFPFVPLAAYGFARNNKDQKMLNFSQEYFASLELALIEAVLISFAPIHKRPSPDGLSFWEKNFRYESSFPSGHLMGFSVLTFKTLQFYGPLYAVTPAVLTVLASDQRVRENKHYISDILGSLLVSFMASEGVKKAAQMKLLQNKTVFKNSEINFGLDFYQGHPEGVFSATF